MTGEEPLPFNLEECQIYPWFLKTDQANKGKE
jgi:hypothetical protein